jgi:hypothetical protein
MPPTTTSITSTSRHRVRLAGDRDGNVSDLESRPRTVGPWDRASPRTSPSPSGRCRKRCGRCRAMLVPMGSPFERTEFSRPPESRAARPRGYYWAAQGSAFRAHRREASRALERRNHALSRRASIRTREGISSAVRAARSISPGSNTTKRRSARCHTRTPL